MRLGFVGCGKWGQRLATAFRACGAEIVAHDRKTQFTSHGMAALSALGFGLNRPWREMLEDKNIDAIIAVAPPEITTEVALACAAAGKPVMATKPLFDHPETIRSVFYVDFWRLWSETHIKMRDEETGDGRFWLYGSGPHRSFPGAFDYGPHAMAAALDIDDSIQIEQPMLTGGPPGEVFSVLVNCLRRHRKLSLVYGNGSPDMAVRDIWGHEETPLAIGDEPKDQILQRFCQSFLNDIAEGFVDTRLLELSRRGMAELRKIRTMAKPSG